MLPASASLRQRTLVRATVDLILFAVLSALLFTVGGSCFLLWWLFGDALSFRTPGAVVAGLRTVRASTGRPPTLRQSFWCNVAPVTALGLSLVHGFGPWFAAALWAAWSGAGLMLARRHGFPFGLGHLMAGTETVQVGHAGVRGALDPRLRPLRTRARFVIVNALAGTIVLQGAIHREFLRNLTPLDVTAFSSERELWTLRPNMVEEPYTHSHIPGMDPRYDSIVVSTNSLGFRDAEHDVENLTGAYRIAFVGDSFVFGLHLDQQHTISSQVETVLRQRAPDRRFEVFNFALPGQNTEAMMEYYVRFAAQYDPDLVIFSFISDDVSRIDNADTHSSTTRMVQSLSWAPRWVTRAAEFASVSFKAMRQQSDFHLLSSLPGLYRKRIVLLMESWAALAQRDGFEIGVMAFHRRTAIRAAAANVTEATGRTFHVIADFEPELNPHDQHPTAASNLRAANEIADLVLRLALE